MGNRNQLQWDLPALDSFELIRAIYRLPSPPTSGRPATSSSSCSTCGELVNKPVRNLSLGERMKMEFVGGPAPPAARSCSSTSRRSASTSRCRSGSGRSSPSTTGGTGATVLLTSHYMADVQALCKRVIVIHHGRILFDGALAELADQFNATKTIGVTCATARRPVGLRRGHGVRGRAGVAPRVPRADAPEVTTRLLRDLPVADLTIEDPPIDDVIEHVFATARPRTSARRPRRRPATARLTARPPDDASRRRPADAAARPDRGRPRLDRPLHDHDADRDRGASSSTGSRTTST